MYRKIVTSLAAAAVISTAFSAAPARAADEDLLRALAAIAGVAIVGKIIVDRNNRKERQDQVSRNIYQPPAVRQHRPLKPRPLPERANRRLLPGDCLRSVDTRDGRYRVFGSRCLERNYRFANQLPRRCEVKFRGWQEIRRGYEARCLHREGYQLARR